MNPRARTLAACALAALVALSLIPLRAGSDEGIPSVLVGPVPGQPAGQGLPPDGTVWWQYAAGSLVPRHQEVYFDDGDGMVSTGDEVQLDGARYPIMVIGPSYYATAWTSCHCDEGTTELGTSVLVPGEAHNPANPIGEVWTDISFWAYNAYYCCPCLGSMTVSQWSGCNPSEPLGECNGVLGPHDVLVDFSQYPYTGYTIDSVGVAVRINEFGAVPTRNVSWGEVKREGSRH